MKTIALLVAFGAIASALAGQGLLRPHFVQEIGDHEFTGEMIVRPRQLGALAAQGMTPYEAFAAHTATAALVEKVALEYRPQTDEYIVKVPTGMTEDSYAAQLLAQGQWQYVEPNWRVFVCETPNDPLYSQQWHHPKIQSSLAWDCFAGNGTVIVAITDTGIKQNHEDLVANLVPGYDAWNNKTQGNGGDVNDTHGHGTHCAGIAGAIGNNGKGVTGVSRQVKLMPIKVVQGGSGGSTIGVLTGGALWAADHGARVISTSFSGFDSSNSVQTTGDYIKHQKNGFYCWAAGNDGRNLTTGDWPDVTIVGASTQSDSRASFSAYGKAIDVFAPGVDILSTYASSPSSYTELSGTSMATPCTAGLAALVTMANPTMTGQQIEDVVYQTCHSIGSQNTYGWGRIDANAGVRFVYNNYPFFVQDVDATGGFVNNLNPAALNALDGTTIAGVKGPSRNSHETGTLSFTFDSTTTIRQMGGLSLTYAAGSSRPDVDQTFELYDWQADQFVVVDQRTTPTSVTTMTISPSSPDRFRNANGLIRARVSYHKALFDIFRIDVDQLTSLTTP